MKVEKFVQLIKVSDVKEKDRLRELLEQKVNVRKFSVKNNSTEEELVEVSPDILDDSEIDLSEESIKGMLDELDGMEKEGELSDDMKKAKQVLNVLSELSSKDKVRDSIDLDNDNVISSDEIKEFLKEVAKIDGNKDSVSLTDVKHKLEAMGFEIDDEGYVVSEDEVKDDALNQSILDNAFEIPQDVASYPVNNSVGSVGGSGGSSGVSGGGGSGYSSGVGGSGGSYTPYSSSGSSYGGNEVNSVSNTKSLEDEKKQIEDDIKTKKDELASARSGEHSEVKAAIDEENSAKEAMDKAIEEDEKVSDELKEKLDNKIDEVDKKEDEIDEKNSKIDETKNSISEVEGSISNLKSALSSLPSPSGKEEDKEKDAKIVDRKKELEKQINDKKREKTKLEKELKTLEGELKTLEGELETLNKEKSEIEEEIKANCGEETKKAIEAYEKAKENVETVKEKVVSSIQGEIDGLQTKLNKVNKKIEEEKNNKASSTFTFDFEEDMTDSQKAALEQFKSVYEQNKDKYKAVEEKTGVPAELIAAINWRESGGNFNTYLHNGDPLGKPTTHVPAGKYFTNWEDAAVDAILSVSRGSVDKNDLQSYYDYAERYNGLGYRNKGVPSPYVWAGTNNYTCGKYVADGKYDPNTKDQQLGVAIMLKALMS